MFWMLFILCLFLWPSLLGLTLLNHVIKFLGMSITWLQGCLESHPEVQFSWGFTTLSFLSKKWTMGLKNNLAISTDLWDKSWSLKIRSDLTLHITIDSKDKGENHACIKYAWNANPLEQKAGEIAAKVFLFHTSSCEIWTIIAKMLFKILLFTDLGVPFFF